MLVTKRKLFSLIAVIILAIVLFDPLTTGYANAAPAIDRAGGYDHRIEVVLEADGKPSPGEVATLNLSATPLIDAPDLLIQWIVPPGVQLIGTDTESLGAVSARQTVTSQRQVRFPAGGTYKVIAQAGFQPALNVNFAASGVLFFTISHFGSTVSDMDPDAHSPMHSIMTADITTSPIPAVGPMAVTGDPCFTVQGNIQRIERDPMTGGYSADRWIPVHNALVDIREEDLIFDDSYGKVLTNSSGDFSKSFCDDDGWFDDELEIYIELRAELRSGGNTVVEVEDSSWIDEVYEYESWVVDSEGGTIVFNVGLNENQSAVFNIADTILDAWNYWNESGGESGGDGTFDEAGEVHWEPGYGDDGSYYMDFWGEITIADDPSDPDQWDDSVIIHEWGHQADDEYSCDDNPGGDHFVNQLVGDPELAWGEGYPDYWQSAVRAAKGYIQASSYIDINGSGTGGIDIDLETWDLTNPTLVSTLSEFGIAAALWDLNDNVNDRQDRVSHGHAMLQDVYTSGTFESVAYGFFDDDCDFDTYMRAWAQMNKPTDAPTAAAVLQNTGYTLTPATLVNNSQPAGSIPFIDEIIDAIWWNQVTYVVDNSASMAGDKFNASKIVLGETVSDLGVLPEGTEFTLATFNNTSAANQVVFAGQFFPDDLTAAINTLSTNGAADGNCSVYALEALSQAIEEQIGGDAWLFTDGDTVQSPSVETVGFILNDHNVRASVALMGVCPGAINSQPASDSPEEQMVQVMLEGAAKAYLGGAAAETPGGLVPYLLTAINSGGQFLFVDDSQLEFAAEILRAQITNSAGAGRWSDYVSDFPTYRWDDTLSWEYNWIDASPFNGGENHGSHFDDGYIDVVLPQPFTYYNAGPYYTAHVYNNGYITLGPTYGVQENNTQIPNSAVPNNALYPFWDALAPHYIICTGEEAPDCGYDGFIYSKQEADWFVIEYYQYDDFTQIPRPVNTFEVQLNATTGEIRYAYYDVPAGASSATIGLENWTGTRGVQVSYNDVNGAISGSGYTFTPAPPQPAKTYTVPVDTHMDAIGFLLTGYSGTFEPLAVYDPNDNLIDCNTPGVLCLDLDLVQYVQVNANGRVGDWHATVDAGASGEGTFSFISMAASPIAVDSLGDHTLASFGNQTVFVDLGLSIDGNILTGWFTGLDDSPCGPKISLYDDGNHGDGFAGDGIFASAAFSPPSAKTCYLWVEGALNGAGFKRIDPVPYRFSPVSVQSLGDGANYGGSTPLQFEVHNGDIHDHCYWMSYQAPDGWWVDLDYFFLPIICVDAGNTTTKTVFAYLNTTPPYDNDLPSGTTGEVAFTVTEFEEGIISDTDSAVVTRHRPPFEINIHSDALHLRPGGDTTTLEIMVVDDEGVFVADGTEIQLSATLGVVSPTVGTTAGGFFLATFTSGPSEGTAIVSAVASGISAPVVVSDTVEIDIGTPLANQIELSTSAYTLPPDGISTATLVVTVLDRYGTPVSGETVRIGVEGDGQLATIAGGEVMTGTTDASGQFSVVLTAGTEIGQVGVRGELIVMDGGQYHVAHEDRKTIQLGTRIFIPIIAR